MTQRMCTWVGKKNFLQNLASFSITLSSVAFSSAFQDPKKIYKSGTAPKIYEDFGAYNTQTYLDATSRGVSPRLF